MVQPARPFASLGARSLGRRRSAKEAAAAFLFFRRHAARHRTIISRGGRCRFESRPLFSPYFTGLRTTRTTRTICLLLRQKREKKRQNFLVFTEFDNNRDGAPERESRICV
jgi:hypothetical protein